jgi:hypothetical protein
MPTNTLRVRLLGSLDIQLDNLFRLNQNIRPSRAAAEPASRVLA